MEASSIESTKSETSENDVVIEAWNTVLFDKFSKFERVLTSGLSIHSEEAIARHPFREGSAVLDVGCGFGDTTRRIAPLLGAKGRAVGVDCADNFIRRAGDDAERAGLKNASFFVADVQSDDLRGPYDRVFARFGTMFFSLPGAAMRNIRRALRPGGELTMVVWRRREDNAWLHEPELRVRAIVPVVSHEDSGQVHCGPGPFSMSGADTVSSLLVAVGFDHITFERFDANICIGRDLDEAVQFAMALGPAGEIIRLAGDEGRRHKSAIDAAMREALAPFVRPDGVWGPSSTWIISARNPG
ncbi:MAG TPA: class I SAM-dependent methyltransferase [Polyangiaceae bacterium]